MSDSPKKGGCFSKLLLLLVAVVAIIAVVWIFFLPSIVTSQLSKRTGFVVNIEKMSINPFTAKASLTGLLITNPPAEFKAGDFVHLEATHAQIDLFSIFKDQFVVESAELNLPSMTVVRNSAGVLNAEAFAKRLVGDSTAPAKPDQPAPSKPMQFLVKKLDVNLGKIVFINEPATGESTTKPLNIDYKHTYQNITRVQDFMTADLARSLLSVGSQLTDLLPSKYGGKVDAVLQQGIKAIDNPNEAATEAAKGLLDKLAPKKK